MITATDLQNEKKTIKIYQQKHIQESNANKFYERKERMNQLKNGWIDKWVNQQEKKNKTKMQSGNGIGISYRDWKK